MRQDLLLEAEAIDQWEQLEQADEHLTFELLPDGRVRAEKAAAYEFLRERLRSAEVLPTSPGWVVIRSSVGEIVSDPLEPCSDIISSGTLGSQGWTMVEIINFVSTTHKSGVLTVHDTTRVSLYFVAGDIVWATSPGPADGFGLFLLRRGHITRDQLHAVIRDNIAVMGRACIERGYISLEQLEPLVQMFVFERFAQFVQAETGLWSFACADESKFPAARWRFPTQMMLVESLRQLDEIRIYRQRIHGASTTITRSPRWFADFTNEVRKQLQGYASELPGQAEVILRAMPGITTISELMERTNQSEFEVTRTIYHLLRANLVQLVPSVEPTLQTTLDINIREVSNIYDLAFSEIMNELSRSGHTQQMLSCLRQFIQEEDGYYRDFLKDIQLDTRGILNTSTLLSGVETTGSFTAKDLVDALGELLFFALLRTTEFLERRKADDLARRVRLIHDMLRHPANSGQALQNSRRPV
ncbi:MAG: DUF4388 domain-containing protein [Myxococcales bacterium]|nr:DUF4388 domain-containing protein [Myxococcales bacterium]